MRRRAMIIAAVAAALTSTSVDLGACGDKYLSAGRGTRIRAYQSIHPATILLYRSANSTAEGVKFYDELLRGAGHTPVFVKHGASIADVIASRKYDLIIASYDDAETVKAQLASAPTKPDVLPILYKPTKTVAAQAARDYQFLLTPDKMTKYDALDQIDHVMERRLSNGSTPARSTRTD